MTSSELWTIVFSVAALLLSGFSVVRQFMRERAEAPAVLVDGSASFDPWGLPNGKPDVAPVWRISLQITNAGGSPVTVQNAGWAVAMAEGYEQGVSEGSDQVVFPLRLEARDSRMWHFARPVTDADWAGLEGYAFAHIVGRPSRMKRGKPLASSVAVKGPMRAISGPMEAF